MTIQIDKAGRLVLPKPIRDRLGFRAGSDIEIEETVDSIVLKAPEHKPTLIQKHGLWVHTGKVPVGQNTTDIVNAVKEQREERIRKLAGV